MQMGVLQTWIKAQDIVIVMKSPIIHNFRLFIDFRVTEWIAGIYAQRHKNGYDIALLSALLHYYTKQFRSYYNPTVLESASAS